MSIGNNQALARPFAGVFAAEGEPCTEPLPDLHPDAWKAERMRRLARRHAGRTRQSRYLLAEVES